MLRVRPEGNELAKRPKSDRCVHCLAHTKALTWDHVFPEAWYPDATPRHLEKWKVPSCEQCNQEYGELENSFLSLVGLCLDPEIDASRGVVEKALRAANPSMAKSERDFEARRRKHRSIMSAVKVGRDIPDHATYPGMGEKWGRSIDEQVAIPVPVDYVTRLAEKFVRGFYYRIGGVLIEPPKQIEPQVLSENATAPFRSILDRFGKEYTRPPAFRIRHAEDEAHDAIVEISLWGQFLMYATVQEVAV